MDPFCGSGTTGEETIKLGRKFIGIDVKPENVEMSIKRQAGVLIKEDGKC